MVVKRRLLLAVASALTLVMTAALPMLGASREADPRPLRQETLLRVKDIAANGNTGKGAIVAVGWHESSKPGQLYLAFSTNGGRDYSRTNGALRKYPIVGVPALGMSLDICANRVWIATGYSSASDKAGDSDVFLTSRTVGGGAAQALLTSTANDRRVRDVSVACIGNSLIAIAWLEKFRNGAPRARVMLRSVEPLGTAPAYKEVFNLGLADFKSGVAVAGTPNALAVAFARNGDMRLRHFDIGAGVPPEVTSYPPVNVARADTRDPVLAARGNRVVVAYSDAGKVKARLSRNLGQQLDRPVVLVGTGSPKQPSRPYSADVVGDRVVVEVGAYSRANGVTPQVLQSTDAGATWTMQPYGHVGGRVGALLKKKGQAPALMEAWHNNAPKGQSDTLRARYELP